jgi:hypothetical protein
LIHEGICQFQEPFCPQGDAIMKTSLITWASSFIVCLLIVSLAFANPDMLPKHPGYPMGKSVDPVKGQPLANDPGQKNASGENALVESAIFDDVHSSQHLSINQNDERLLEKAGAGILPKVQGPNIKIEPPVKEATKINASPQ